MVVAKTFKFSRNIDHSKTQKKLKNRSKKVEMGSRDVLWYLENSPDLRKVTFSISLERVKLKTWNLACI